MGSGMSSASYFGSYSGSAVVYQSRPRRRRHSRHTTEDKSNPTTTTEHHPKRRKVITSGRALGVIFLSKKQLSRKKAKEAKDSALIVRSLIAGPSSPASPRVSKATAISELNRVNACLTKPKTANRVIAELRTLPADGQEVKLSSADGPGHKHATGDGGPIRGVCLANTEEEEDKLHFSKLPRQPEESDEITSLSAIGSASIEQLTNIFNEMHIVDLLTAPDLGLGQPGDGPGLLSGALPTPETVIKGIEQITPQIMALGYAAGKAIVTDHQGIYPPTDRMSLLTYWWGLEVVLPPPSLDYLSRVQSISGTVINFLTALSVVNNGVREILPFVRYIAQYIDFEFAQIKKQNQGKGVVCAATWLMPAALVPRPWDFPDPPIPSINPPKDKEELDRNDPPEPSEPVPATPKPTPSNGIPFITPIPVHSVLDAVVASDTTQQPTP